MTDAGVDSSIGNLLRAEAQDVAQDHRRALTPPELLQGGDERELDPAIGLWEPKGGGPGE